MGAGGHHPGTLLDRGHDSGRRPARSRRRQGDDRAALAGKRRTTNEVHLAADPGIHPMADAVRHDLAGQVDLDGRVDRGHPAERPDDVRVVREVDGSHLDHRVVTHEVVDALRSHQERGDDLAAVAFLAAPVDHPAFDEIDDDIGEHLGVDAEVALVHERRAHRRRDPADAHLDRGAIGNEIRHELPDPPLDLSRHADQVLVRGHVALDREVDLVDVDEAVAQGSRDGAVELDDDRLCGPDRGVDGLDAGSERAESMGIRWCGIDEDGIEPDQPGFEQARNIGQERRDVLRATLVDRGARVRTDEQGPVSEVRRHLGREMGARSLAMEMDDPDVAQLRGSRDERIEQDRRRGRCPVQVDLLAGLDVGNGFLGSDDTHGPSIRPREVPSRGPDVTQLGGQRSANRRVRAATPGSRLGRSAEADQPVPRSNRRFATKAAACARRSRLSFERIELT